MRRWDAAIVTAGLVVAALGLWIVRDVGEGFIAVVTVATMVVAAVTLNHTLTRRPDLEITYRNPAADDEPVVWRADPAHGKAVYLYVVLENRGPGSARAVEVDFDTLGVEVWNETGNFPGPYVDVTLSPARFIGRERVLNGGDRWVLARLHAISNEWTGGTARWRARAEGVPEKADAIEIRLLDGPPEVAAAGAED